MGETKFYKNLWVYIFSVIVAVTLYTFFSGTDSGYDDTPWIYDDLAQYLTEQGAIMYGTDWCPFCQEQKNIFGNSFRFINYVDCDRSRAACNSAGVQSYPTWVVNGERHTGVQSPERLAALSGFQE